MWIMDLMGIRGGLIRKIRDSPLIWSALIHSEGQDSVTDHVYYLIMPTREYVSPTIMERLS